MIIGSIHQEDIIFVNTYTLTVGAPKYININIFEGINR